MFRTRAQTPPSLISRSDMISEDKNRLTTGVDANGNKIGIALWEIYSCLRYYKRDTRGNRNLGMVIENGATNLLSKYKPTDFAGDERLESWYKGDGAKDGYFLGYDCYGVKKPHINNSQFILLGADGVPNSNDSANNGAKKIVGIDFAQLVGDWAKTDYVKYRFLDFDGYCQIPANNIFTNGTSPYVSFVSVMNPNGGIAGSAQLRYNWEDIQHEDGKSATLGLKSLLACDGVNSKAYLGVAVYRTLPKTPNSSIVLNKIAIAKIHTAELGTVCPNTGMVEIHNVAFDFQESGIVSGYESSITNGYSNFYIGEKEVKAIPFIAKWSGSEWHFIGLGVTPTNVPTLSASGGSGSTKNNVEITKVVCKLTAVRNSDNTIQIGIANDADFAITVTGRGDLAFQKNNQFYITPADGNSTLRSQSSVRLGVSSNAELELPVTAVSAGTYYASSLMYGRTNSAGYTSPPSSSFSASGKFKVGFTIPYYKRLTTWTYLNGNVEIDPSQITSGNPKTYTITIEP